MWWQGDVVTGWWGWQGDVVTGWGTHRLLWTPASGRPGPSRHLTALLEQSQVWPETWGWGGFGLKKSWKVEYWFQWRASSQGTGARVHSGFEEPNQVQWGWNQGGVRAEAGWIQRLRSLSAAEDQAQVCFLITPFAQCLVHGGSSVDICWLKKWVI